ncbi:unnamed protein product [Boreogadus saida]
MNKTIQPERREGDPSGKQDVGKQIPKSLPCFVSRYNTCALGARVVRSRGSSSSLPTGWVALSWGPAGQRQQQPPYGLGGSQLGARRAAAAAASPRAGWLSAGGPPGSGSSLPTGWVALSWGPAGQRQQRPPYGLGGSQLGARRAAAAASLRAGWLSAGGPPGSGSSSLPTGWVALSWGPAGQRQQQPPYGLGGSQLGARRAAAAAASLRVGGSQLGARRQRQQQPPYGLGGSQLGARRAAAAAASLRAGWLSAGGPPGSGSSSLPTGWVALSWGPAGQRQQQPPYGLGGSQLGARRAAAAAATLPGTPPPADR